MRIIGCGNRGRGDDAAGVLVVERLRDLGVESPGVRAEICSGESAELIDALSSEEEVLLVDAVVTGAPPGTVHKWESEVPQVARGTPVSTHGFGVGEALRLAKALGRAPRSLRVYGIEGSHFDRGAALSPAVEQAVKDVTQRICNEIRALQCRYAEDAMCLAIPGKIVSAEDSNGLRVGRVQFGGITRQVSLDFVPEAAIGDYVLVHVGFAISRVDAAEAERTYQVLEEMGVLQGELPPEDATVADKGRS